MGTIYRNGVPFVGSGGAGGVEMTQEEYDDLPTSEKMNGAIYFITDGDVSYPTASQMRYDNTESQIPSTTVQGAIDENRIEINDLKNGLIKSVTATLTTNTGGIVQGGVTTFGMPSGAIILTAYLNKGDYSNNRSIDAEMYGTAGYKFKFYDNGTAIASSNVSVTFYYIIP